MSKNVIITSELIKLLDQSVDALSIAHAQSWLDAQSNSGMVYFVVSKLASVHDAGIKNWLKAWLKRRPDVNSVLAMLESMPCEEAITSGMQLVREDVPNPRIGLILLRLMQLEPNEEMFDLAETWLGSRCFDESANAIFRLLLKHKSKIASESYLLTRLHDKNLCGILMLFFRHKLGGGITRRIAKRYLRIHLGTYESALVLGELIRRRSLKNKRKWIEEWLDVAPKYSFFCDTVLAYAVMPKGNRYLLKLIRELACDDEELGLTSAVKLLLKIEKSGKTKIWLSQWLEQNITHGRAKTLISTLLDRYGTEQRTILVVRQWLSHAAVVDRNWILSELIKKGVADEDILEMALEFIREFPDDEMAFSLAVDVVPYRHELVSYLKDHLKLPCGGTYKLPMAALAILPINNDAELRKDLLKWMNFYDHMHQFDRTFLSGWASSARRILELGEPVTLTY